MTKFISYYARRNNLLAVFFLIFGTSIFLIPSAQAAYANTTVICANPAGEQRSYQIGWDNSNQFFADKGYIPQFFCEGGYAVPYRTYVSDTLNGGALGYFNGVITSSNPTPSVPSPSPSPSPSESATADTATSTSPTDTPTPSSSPEPQSSPSPSSETQTSTSDTATSVNSTDTSTQSSETTTNTASNPPNVSPVDGSTATSQPEPQPAPTPPIPEVIVPEPEPVVAPEEEPLPEPEVVEEVATEEVPEPVIAPEVEPEEEVIPEPEVEATVTLDNGVVLTQEQAVAVALLQDPMALVQELFTNPAAALAALGQVGADMSPEVREKSEKVVISAVIAGNIATQAAATAGAVAALRRKP